MAMLATDYDDVDALTVRCIADSGYHPGPKWGLIITLLVLTVLGALA